MAGWEGLSQVGRVRWPGPLRCSLQMSDKSEGLSSAASMEVTTCLSPIPVRTPSLVCTLDLCSNLPGIRYLELGTSSLLRLNSLGCWPRAGCVPPELLSANGSLSTLRPAYLTQGPAGEAKVRDCPALSLSSYKGRSRATWRRLGGRKQVVTSRGRSMISRLIISFIPPSDCVT